MTHDRCNCYFSFWAIFYPFTPLTAQRSKFKKMPGDIIILHMHMCTKYYDQMVYVFLRYDAQQTDGQKDRRMEKGTHRGGCPT